jgi:hypothetical protein
MHVYNFDTDPEWEDKFCALISSQVADPNDPSKADALRGAEMKHGKYTVYAIHLRSVDDRCRWVIKDNSQLDKDGLPVIVAEFLTLSEAVDRVS